MLLNTYHLSLTNLPLTSYRLPLTIYHLPSTISDFPLTPYHLPVTTQLSIKVLPYTWLPKTLAFVQFQPNIAELWPAMVTYSPSNHSSQYNSRLFLCLVFSKFIQNQKWLWSGNNETSSSSFPKTKQKHTGFWNLVILYSRPEAILKVIFGQFFHHLLSEITF